ncbi:Mur ligase family protein [bacterium]|nr:Mur ligase family protein [bacterium]
MKPLRFYTSVLLGKLAVRSSRLFRFGGTSYPGKLALSIYPSILKELGEKLKLKVFITGTNGKTTTARVIATILEGLGTEFVHNRAGANLIRGVCTSLIERYSFRDSLCNAVGVFEIDEANLRLLVKDIKPDTIVITNLFRDQLDRYGEVDKLAGIFRGIAEANPDVTFIVNADDPLVSSVTYNIPINALYFGIDYKNEESYSSIADIRSCPFCDETLAYSKRYMGHQGVFECLACGFKRQEPDIVAYNINSGLDSSSFDILFKDKSFHIDVRLPGIYNVYNTLSALLSCYSIGIPIEKSIENLSNVRTAFGRGERLNLKGKTVYILLAKNPASFNEIIQLLSNKKDIVVLLIINDNIQDGMDVSWLWDVNFEALMERSSLIVASGRRAYDMALRLKYGGFDIDRLLVEENSLKALELAIEKSDRDEIFVIPTYTAMLELRKKLESLGVTKGFWKD